MDRRTLLVTIAATAPAVTGCLAGGVPEREANGTDVPSYRLRIENQSDRRQTVEVRLTKLDDEGEVSGEPTTESYSLAPEARISLDDRIEPSTHYEVTVRVEGGATERWTLHDYAGLTVVIESTDRLEGIIAEA